MMDCTVTCSGMSMHKGTTAAVSGWQEHYKHARRRRKGPKKAENMLFSNLFSGKLGVAVIKLAASAASPDAKS